MTKEKAAFIAELRDRAPHSSEGGMLSRAASMLTAGEGDAVDAYTELANAEREAAREGLSEWHLADVARRVVAAQAAVDALTAPPPAPPVATKGPVKPTEKTEEVAV